MRFNSQRILSVIQCGQTAVQMRPGQKLLMVGFNDMVYPGKAYQWQIRVKQELKHSNNVTFWSVYD